MEAIPLKPYLARIGLSQTPKADESGLALLHRAQCLAMPFENVEPLLGRPVSLELPKLWEKFMERNRGGYCFELNSFFHHALLAAGFREQLGVGRVKMGKPQLGPRTHLVNFVELNGRTWLCDVGFGGPGLVDPIPFEDGFQGEQNYRPIRLRRDPDWGMLYEEELPEGWRTIYALPDEKVLPIDLEVGNHFCSTHPSSIFRSNLTGAFPHALGKTTVWNRSVQLQEGLKKTERLLKAPADFAWLFREQFKINLSDADCEALHAKLPPLSV